MKFDGHFPVSASKVALAHEVCGRDETKVIGVSITILVETEHVHELPEPWRKIAHNMLYREAAQKDDVR